VQEEFISHFQNQFPFTKGKRLLIAISGGLDSVVLAQLCHQLHIDFALAHCNFALRGNESDLDEVFVTNLAKQLKVEVFKIRFQTEAFAKSKKLSTQLAARQLRYHWFEELLKKHQFDYLLTAHHADDNLETLLINLSRGTGLQGLLGIPEINDNILRPLLPFTRTQIETFAKEQKIDWREDSSNASTKYLRNKLRHDVIPILKEINPDILKNTNTTISHLKETADIVEESVDAVLKRAILSLDDSQIIYDVEQFIKLNNPKAYIREIFKNFGFTAFNDIVDLLQAQTGKIINSESHQLLKNRDTLILSPLESQLNFETEINAAITDIETPLGILKFEIIESVDVSKNHNSNTVYIDFSKLKFPLHVRLKKDGDYFYPLGMKGKKKISKYFKDEKMSLLDKEKALLLLSDNAIVWIINHRLDNRFRVTNNTTRILKISLI